MEEGGVQKSVDRYWSEIMDKDGNRPDLVRKVHTECRQNFNMDMVKALLQYKLNNERSCIMWVSDDDWCLMATFVHLVG